mgnify:CR=1 FL=1
MSSSIESSFPRFIREEDMGLRAKEWELAGYVVREVHFGQWTDLRVGKESQLGIMDALASYTKTTARHWVLVMSTFNWREAQEIADNYCPGEQE